MSCSSRMMRRASFFFWPELDSLRPGPCKVGYLRTDRRLSAAHRDLPCASPRSYASFSEAIAEIADARVFGGIHLRSSCARGNSLGRAVADYVSRHAMRAPGDEQDE